jgi:SAM-dependent methyltransferase
VPVSKSDPYLLGYRSAEQDRLERQADELAHDSSELFDDIGVREGWSVVEVGCGPRGCLGLLAERVGATGRVVGVERNAEHVERARRFILDRHLANVEVLQADARGTGLPEQSFDLTTARLVLINVPRPEQLIDEMVKLVRPGGVVALHEPDPTPGRLDPPHFAQARLLELRNTVATLNGIDWAIGPRIPRMLREAGVLDIRVRPMVHIYPLGHGRRMIQVELAENIRDRLLDAHLITSAEFDALIAALKRHLEDPNTLVLSNIFIQAWGRTPERR